METSLWLEFRACLCARCAPDSSHSSILTWRAAVESQMWLWLEFRASGGVCGGMGGRLPFYAGLEFCAHLAQR